MQVLLAGPDYEENLSIRYLSAALMKAGHETVLAPFNSAADIDAVADAARDADIVGLSLCFQSRALEFLGLARVIKARDPKKLIVAGGHYASCAAGDLLDHHPELDVVVIHEGENTMVEIAEHGEQRLAEVAGIAYREDGKVRFTPRRHTLNDLDALPFADRRGRIHTIAGVPTSYMMGSRGCYGNCAYCCITSLHRMAPGKRFRQRRVERIADEMEMLYRERGTRQFVFHDDNFLVPSVALNHARIAAFGKAVRQRGIGDIALVIKCRPADANRDVLRRLKDLGLVRVFMGVESSTELGLSSLERTQTVEESVRALETCAELDISAQFTLMIFNPDTTPETLRSDVAFMRRFSGNPLNFCRTEIYAGTPLEKRMIETGRARGNYLAREYSMASPAIQFTSDVALDLFHSRCWSGGSLMQRAIGLDHMAALRKRFGSVASAETCRRADTWLRSVNLDTVGLLENVVELCAPKRDARDPGFRREFAVIAAREAASRRGFDFEGARLREELEMLESSVRTIPKATAGHRKLARRAAVAVLAFGMPAAGCHYGVSEMAPPPLKETQAPQGADGGQQGSGSITGTVKDATGAVVAKAKITVTNTDSGKIVRLETDPSGQFAASDLPEGRYSVRAESAGFKQTLVNDIVLKDGKSERVDIKLEIGNYGCCEYAAAPLKVENLAEKQKPFTYYVGTADDHGTFQGIAKLVYGDSNKWVQIFEANREVVEKPGSIPFGKAIVIPKSRREVPKLIAKVLPSYPAEAAQKGLVGDVLMEVSLKDDGTVDQVNVIDGDPLLVDAATAAVKQWKYRPLVVKANPVTRFVVVVSFGKGGKVRVE